MSFTADLTRFVNHANGNIDLVVKKVVLDIGRRLVEKSPVGDAAYWQHPAPAGYTGGRFRANWQHGVGQAPSGEFDETANVSMARIAGSVPQHAGGKLHYIVNNLPYSIRLENGWSRQAPQGVVGLSVTEFYNAIRQAASELR